MRTKLSLVFATVLLCVFSTAAQNVIESESSVSVDGRSLNVSLVIQSDAAKQNVPARLDAVDTNGVARSSVSRELSVEAGKHEAKFQLSLDRSSSAPKDDIAWYRLRYRVGESAGVISMSQLIKDLFELRVIGSDNLLAGM